MPETTNIYALVDPRNDSVRYIGKANNVNKRKYAHIKDTRTNHRSCWIKGLKNEGLRPELFIVEVVKKDDWQFWERYWIAQFKAWGFDLTNRTEGGEGTEHTEETKKLMSEIKKEYFKTHVHHRRGVKVSKEEKERLRKMATGRIQSKETIEKRRKSRAWYRPSEETKRKMSIAQKKVGHKITPENREKMVKALREKGAWNKGMKNTISDEGLKRIMEVHAKPVLQFDLEGNFIKEWPSGKSVMRGLGVLSVHHCCRGEIKTCGGFKWKYKNDV